MLGLIILVGIILRLSPVAGAGFPLNDGGLFLTMAEDLRANGFMLPRYASYNDLAIPYAYPPLGFYLTALAVAAGIPGVDVLRVVPLLASIATVPVVYAIGREIFRTERMALATAAFFALSTGSFEWLIMGGGITRAPGFLLALIAVLLAIRMYAEGGRTLPFIAGLALGATGLWHPQAGIFAALSVALLLPFLAHDRRRALWSLVSLAATAIVVAVPWLVIVIAQHGPEPLLSAAGTGGTPLLGLLSLLTSRTSAGYLEVLGAATTLGLVVCALRGFWLAPVWIVAIVVVDGRAGQPYVSVPAAMAVAFLVRDIGSVVRRHLADAKPRRRWAALARWAPIALFVALLGAAFADSLASRLSTDSPLRAVATAERDAMAWVAEEAEPEASFVVVSGRYWALDAESEWFPVLAERHSVATVQGYEWLGSDAFERQRDRAGVLAPCVATSDMACVERWFDDIDDVDYLFLTRSPVATAAGLECCHQLADQIDAIRPSQVVYQDAAVVIVQLLPQDR